MKVKITSCFDKEWWHSEHIGQVVEVEYWSEDAYFVKEAEEHGAVLPKRDTMEDENGQSNIVKNTPSILTMRLGLPTNSVDIPNGALNPLNSM
jgi:hypothetical protein